MKITKNDNNRYIANINGDEFEFEKFGAEMALDNLMLIGSLIGGPLGEALANMYGPGGKGFSTQITPDFARKVMAQLASRMRDDRQIILGLLKKFAAWNVLCNGKPIVFDDFYVDRLQLVYQVMQANLEVQYGPSYAGVIAEFSEAPTPAATSQTLASSSAA